MMELFCGEKHISQTLKHVVKGAPFRFGEEIQIQRILTCIILGKNTNSEFFVFL